MLVNVKERPLIHAVSNPDPMPRFLFANPIISGFIATMLGAMLGGFSSVVIAHAAGTPNTDLIVISFQLGVVVAAGLFIVLTIMTFFGALSNVDERNIRLQFVLGTILGITAIVLLNLSYIAELYAWFNEPY